MKKFLVVGCGGSGGSTLHYLMDQLKADLRRHGIQEIPDAWQFLHIDVNPDPPRSQGLGNIRDLGGSYHSVSAPGNTYQLVATQVEQLMTNKGLLRSMLGWAPAPKETAAGVAVTSGAGQYRAVGRMLTVTSIDKIQSTLGTLGARLQDVGAWGDLPQKFPEGGPYDKDAAVIPILVASMAGGSGASMFLDVARMLGRVPGVNRAELGVFLFTPDVFSSLDKDLRIGVDGNALGAIGEIIAAQARASDRADAELYAGLGVAPEADNFPAFARIFPIGMAIGGDGARFGDGSPAGVFRGIGRALAATMISEKATFQYVSSKIENPASELDRDPLGWGADKNTFTWGSFGYASLSLGRDRYAEYAAQRLARSAFDQVQEGYKKAHSDTTPDEQLVQLLNGQFPTILQKLNFPSDPAANVRSWFTDQVLTAAFLNTEAPKVAQGAVNEVNSQASVGAATWFGTLNQNLARHQGQAAEVVRRITYQWTVNWATHLEEDLRREFLAAVQVGGVPYALELVRRLRGHLNPIVERLKTVVPTATPLRASEEAQGRVAQLGNAVVGAGHELASIVTQGYINGSRDALVQSAASMAAGVLSSYVTDVLGSLERTAAQAVSDLQIAAAETQIGAGLAQLQTNTYKEWPLDEDRVPGRFDQADNEVLLTTSADFPGQFRSDVLAAAPMTNNYEAARDEVVRDIVRGSWVVTGGVDVNIDVLEVLSLWRPESLPTNPADNTLTPRSVPVYRLAIKPAEVLGRARLYLERTDRDFHKFSSQTISDFLMADGSGMGEAQHRERVGEFVRRFSEAMALARPLVGVSAPMVSRLHNKPMSYQFSFGDLPLSTSPEVVAQIRAGFEQAGLDQSTFENFEKALVPPAREDKQTRIAIFGGYPKYSPLVFSSLLDQVGKRWSGADDQAKRGLWQWKRTRPLPASLAMSGSEQRAMIEGWFIGRLLGAVAVPPNLYGTDPVQVWSQAAGGWLAFPNPLLTPANRFKHADDWLPAVMESHTLAVVQSNNDINLAALKPYMALRALSDDASGDPLGSYGQSSGDRFLTEWLKAGHGPSGRASEIKTLATAAELTADERHEAATAWLGLVAEHVRKNYLTEPTGVGELAVRRPRVTQVADLAEARMFAEIADVALEVLVTLGDRLEQALRQARVEQPPASGSAGPTGVVDDSPF